MSVRSRVSRSQGVSRRGILVSGAIAGFSTTLGLGALSAQPSNASMADKANDLKILVVIWK